jgi:hypothetical protein
VLIGRTALVGAIAEHLNERWLQAPHHPSAWEQGAAHPLLIPAALLGVAALGSLQGRLGAGLRAARGRPEADDVGAKQGGGGGGGGDVGWVDLWAGRGAMVFYLWFLVSER